MEICHKIVFNDIHNKKIYSNSTMKALKNSGKACPKLT